MPPKGSGKASGPKGAVKQYLIAYNAVSAGLWLAVLVSLVRHVTQFAVVDKAVALFSYALSGHSLAEGAIRSRTDTTFLEIGTLTKWVQTGALLEIVHALLGFVRSSVPTTAAQVASRIFIVWVICELFPLAARSPFYTTMVLAWSVTEVIRYTHYVLTLLGTKVGLLEWLRYTTFYVLYPMGAGSEAALVYASAAYAGRQYGDGAKYALYALTLLWPPALAVMMSHMHAQRRKHLGAVRVPASVERKAKAVKGKADEAADEARSTATSAKKQLKKKSSTMQLRGASAEHEDASDLSDTPAKSTRSKKAVR